MPSNPGLRNLNIPDQDGDDWQPVELQGTGTEYDNPLVKSHGQVFSGLSKSWPARIAVPALLLALLMWRFASA